MTIEARKQSLAAIRLRYKNATRKQQGLILDEFCQVCGYTRQHAIRILGQMAGEQRSKPGPKAKYDSSFMHHLVSLWKLMNYMCSLKMKVAIPIWLPYYKQSVALTTEDERKLHEVSPSTIDRLLKPILKVDVVAAYIDHNIGCGRSRHLAKLKLVARIF